MLGFSKTTQKTEEKRTPSEVFADLTVRGHFKLALPALEVACLKAMNDWHIGAYSDLTVTVDKMPLWLCYPIEGLSRAEEDALNRAADSFVYDMVKVMEERLLDTIGEHGVSLGVTALLTKTMASARPLRSGGISITFTKRGSEQTTEVLGRNLVDLLERAEKSIVWVEGKEVPLAGWGSPEMDTLREVVRLAKEADEKGIPRGMYRY